MLNNDREKMINIKFHSNSTMCVCILLARKQQQKVKFVVFLIKKNNNEKASVIFFVDHIVCVWFRNSFQIISNSSNGVCNAAFFISVFFRNRHHHSVFFQCVVSFYLVHFNFSVMTFSTNQTIIMMRMNFRRIFV